MFVPVIYQDEDIVVVNKPIGLTTHPTESDDPATTDVISAIKQQLSLGYIGVHHRLDREVSGVLVFAARKQANAGLAKVFEGRTVQKEYLAIVAGRLPRSDGEINMPLTEAGGGRYEIARSNDRRAQAARTRYRVEQTTPDGRLSLVRLWLETGRTHQLRVHLAYVGAPIIGDAIYGNGQKFPRLLLHAARLTFAHPATNEMMTFEAAPPPIFKRLRARQALPEIELARRLLTSEAGLLALTPADEKGLGHLLDLAIVRRAPFAQDPQQATTGYCMINGVGDGLPGLLLDRVGETLLLNSTVPGLSENSLAFKLLVKHIETKLPGYVVRLNSENKLKENWGLRLRENKLDFELQPGFMLDLREMRERVRTWSKDQTVLNCYNSTGDFGIVATAGGAKRVLSLDTITNSLALPSYRLNGFEPDPQNFRSGEVEKLLGELARQQQKFDLLILSQPFDSAPLNYPRLARLAGQVIAVGGKLLAISTDARLERRKFREQLLKGLREAGRTATVTGVYHEPELDFPRFEEAEGYLKVFVIKLD